MQPLLSAATRRARVSGHSTIATTANTNRTTAKRIGENNKANRPNETVVAFCLSTSSSQKGSATVPADHSIGFTQFRNFTHHKLANFLVRAHVILLGDQFR